MSICIFFFWCLFLIEMIKKSKTFYILPRHDGQCSVGLGRHWWAVVTHPQPTTHTQTRTAGQSFFTRACGPLTGLGEGLPPCKADWQDWHLRIATLIMGICSDAPVWGPSRVLGCCHRDGGEPLVVFLGGRQRPRYSPEGWPDMTPHDSPLLIWVGNSEQPARRDTHQFRFILRTVGADPVRLTEMEKFRFWWKNTVSVYESWCLLHESEVFFVRMCWKNPNL